jgi:integrase/recombinase XerD
MSHVPTVARQTIDQLIELWVHGKSVHTQRYYRKDAHRFKEFVGKPIDRVTLIDLQAFCNHLTSSNLTGSSQGRVISSVKALLKFGHQLGVLPVDVGKPIRPPKVKDTLTERILSEATVLAMIGSEHHPRNRALLKLLYGAGLRVSELCRLKWRDLQPRDYGGTVTVYGKGGVTRVVALDWDIWFDLMSLRSDANRDDPVFKSRNKGGHLSNMQVIRIVRAAALRVGVTDVHVSPHWLRHAHASHALEHGAPIHLVQATLGHSSIATTGRYLHARPGISSARYLRLGAVDVSKDFSALLSNRPKPVLPDGNGNLGF